MPTPCPHGCRTKPHGNKGRVPTLKQLEALRAGRMKLAMSLMQPDHKPRRKLPMPSPTGNPEVDKELESLQFYVDKLHQDPTNITNKKLIEKQQRRINRLMNASIAVAAPVEAPVPKIKPGMTGIASVDSALRDLQFYKARLSADPSSYGKQRIVTNQQKKVDAAMAAAGIKF